MADPKSRRDDLNWLFAPLDEIREFRELTERLDTRGVCLAYGLEDTQRLHMIAGLQQKNKRLLLFVTANDQQAQRAMDDLSVFLHGRVALFPAREVSFQRMAASSRDLSARRIEALGRALSGEADALIVPVDALMYRLMPKDSFTGAVLSIREGMRTEPKEFIERLVKNGYERVDVVENRGQCALRGGILDVYPVGHMNAIRMEFFDDEVDSLRDFDVLSQRSVSRIDEAHLLPASEALLTFEQADAAANRLEAALKQTVGREDSQKEDRQHTLEAEFGLTPWEEFEKEIENEDELPTLADMGKSHEAQPALPPRSELEKQFLPHIDALRTHRALETPDAFMPFLYEEPVRLTDYFPDALVVLDQPDRLRERCENRLLEFQEQFKTALERETALPEQANLLMPYDDLLPALLRGRTLALTSFLRSLPDVPAKALYKFDGIGATGYQGNLHEMVRDIRSFRKEGWRIALLAGGVARGQRLNRSLRDLNAPVPFEENPVDTLMPGEPVILPVGISKGFQYPGIRFLLVSETDMFGVGRQKSRSRWQSGGEKISAFTDLSVGDYVVHEQYGIGQYMGTVRLQSDGTYGDYLHIRYQGTDKLYVPTDQLDRVQKYIGSEGEPPRINKLSGNEWQKQKARVKAGIQEIAGDLVKLYAERQAASGFAYAADSPWQRQFEDSFEYEETPDQLQAIEEIKRDMERPQVMDRLLCGDVGYGKTEVALRAIFKSVVDGKQAALLAPTTILVQQHYATMMKRFKGFPVHVDTLSRFRTPAEQKLTLGALKRGEIDVIIGTHRLLGKDVKYKDLGLLVIDEEQRFGVQHKETIKHLKKSVDVLTLSATPIPRTLHMSMVGIRDMSLLRTPPDERYPVQTYVVEYSDALVRDAILREMGRGGQVYVLYNRVQSIERFYERLRQLVPEARIAVGHGQMREHMLEDVMLDFYEGKYDVLLCTTIIEAGLDVPLANTMIVIDADRFGLSQLYQLRGRVGRSNRLAYAYLTVQPNKVLSETADKRLSAIREFTEFGSGFRVAMRDLEIRGTGNLLGAQQSGHMAAVGYDLYVKMIEETVREMRGDVTQGDIATRMEVRIDAYLPGDYVPSDQTRIEVYKRIAAIDSKDARDDLIEELIDRFGDPTRPVMNLIDIAHLKGLCGRIGIETVSLKQGQLIMKFSPHAQLELMRLVEAIQKNAKVLTLQAGNPPSIAFKDGIRAADDLVRRAVPIMEDVVTTVLKEDKKS